MRIYFGFCVDMNKIKIIIKILEIMRMNNHIIIDAIHLKEF